MKRSKFSEEQVVYALRQSEAGTPVGDLCRQLGVSEATFYAWKKKYAHLGVTELRRLRREGWLVNRKRVRRLYRLEGLQLRMRVRRRKHIALHRGPAPTPGGPTERWSMDFVHDRLADGRPFRILTVVDNWSRQSPILEVAFRMSGEKVGHALDRVLGENTRPRSITVDHGTEFQSRALEDWAYRHGVQLDFIRPGKPVENAFIESFKGRLRDECLNVHQFSSLEAARTIIETWRLDYNQHRPHSSLGHLTPNGFLEQRRGMVITKEAICSG